MKCEEKRRKEHAKEEKKEDHLKTQAFLRFIENEEHFVGQHLLARIQYAVVKEQPIHNICRNNRNHSTLI